MSKMKVNRIENTSTTDGGIDIDTSGNVGIGGTTVTDSNLLNIQGSSATSNIGLVFNDTNTSKIYGIQNGGSALKVFDYTTSTERLRIDSSGNVGIGTSAPTRLLTVQSSGNANFCIKAASTGVSQCMFGDTDSDVIGNIAYRHDVDALTFEVNASERLRIDSSGKVGIGTSSPEARLHVKGTTSNPSDVEPLVLIENDTGTGGDVSLRLEGGGTLNPEEVYLEFCDRNDPTNSFAVGLDDDAQKLAFGYSTKGSMNGHNQMILDSSGRVGIGTSSPTHGLHVEHGTAVARFHHTSSTNTTAMIFRHGRGLSGFQGKMVSMQRNDGTEVGNIIIGAASTAFNTSSDYRLKENVVGITDGITRVKQLSPRRFNFIADDTTTVDGFIAHEAQVIVPECVTGVKDEVDDDGNAVMQGIDQSKLVPLLTAALQEAIAKIETLEQRLTDAGL